MPNLAVPEVSGGPDCGSNEETVELELIQLT